VRQRLLGEVRRLAMIGAPVAEVLRIPCTEPSAQPARRSAAVSVLGSIMPTLRPQMLRHALLDSPSAGATWS